jgi:hypothetical protein
VLRLLVVLLLAANGVFYAWTQGWLAGASGTRARGEREPERAQQQVQPDAVKLLRPQAASAAIAAAEMANAAVCLDVGPFGADELEAAERQLAPLPPGSWARVAKQGPARWIVYMGRFADRETLARKVDEVKRRQLPFEEVRGAPSLEPGLSLGSYDNRAAADAALASLVERGVSTARVVAMAPAAPTTLLRVERADAGLRAQLGALGAALAPCASRQ